MKRTTTVGTETGSLDERMKFVGSLGVGGEGVSCVAVCIGRLPDRLTVQSAHVCDTIPKVLKEHKGARVACGRTQRDGNGEVKNDGRGLRTLLGFG